MYVPIYYTYIIYRKTRVPLLPNVRENQHKSQFHTENTVVYIVYEIIYIILRGLLPIRILFYTRKKNRGFNFNLSELRFYKILNLYLYYTYSFRLLISEKLIILNYYIFINLSY